MRTFKAERWARCIQIFAGLDYRGTAALARLLDESATGSIEGTSTRRFLMRSLHLLNFITGLQQTGGSACVYVSSCT